MNEVVERLRECNQDRFESITLPDDDELVVIQEQLLLHLPPDLKDFLLCVSDVAYGSLQPVTVTDDFAASHLPEMASVAWDRGLSRECLPICEFKDGYYFITQEGNISFWSAKFGVDEESHWDSIWYWCERVWLES
jgi:hypothetical protein